MSRRTYSGVVPFKVENVFVGDNDYEDLAPSPMRELLKAQDTWDEGDPPVVIAGWSHKMCDAQWYPKEGARHALLAGKFEKVIDGVTHVVFEINEDEYQNGGGVSQSFFADKKESLELFCKDWGFDGSKIEANAPAQQTL